MIKKLFTIAFISFLCAALNAQDNKTFRFGLKGGLNFSTMSCDEHGNTVKDRLTSFNLSGLVDIPIHKDIICIQPSLGLSGKGVEYKLKESEDGDHGKIKVTPYYAELQTNFLFKAPLSDNFKFYVGAGPYLSAGLFGKTTIEGRFFGEEVNIDKNIHYTSKKVDYQEPYHWSNLKRFDYGYNLLLGVELSRYIVSASYTQGVANVQPKSKKSGDASGKNGVFSVSVGLYL
ncbi:MAG: porin family protein [Dysgonomonas sp.]|nr:porin family protein [Dysgonomonas sp.]